MLWLRAFLFNLLLYGWTGLLLIVGLPALPFMPPPTVRRYARFWMLGVQAVLRAVVGLRHEVHGLENLPPGPVILASKHQSAWETLFFHIPRPDTVIGLKQELGRIPGFGWYLARAGNIFIDRGGAAKALRSLVEGAKAAVGQGCSILIFPEGTRMAPGAPPDYKSGVAALYAALGIPCVPVALDSGRYWGRRSFLKLPGTIHVHFLPPIPPGLDRRTFMARLEGAIEGRMAELLPPTDDRAPDGRPIPP